MSQWPPFDYETYLEERANYAALVAERDALRKALRALVRKGTDGRWYTSQNGDSDVTHLVGAALSHQQREEG